MEHGHCLGELHLEGWCPVMRPSQHHLCTFPAQDVSLRVGDVVIDPETKMSPGRIVELRRQPARVLRRSRASACPRRRECPTRCDESLGAGLRYAAVLHEATGRPRSRRRRAVREVVSALVDGRFVAADGTERALEAKDVRSPLPRAGRPPPEPASCASRRWQRGPLPRTRGAGRDLFAHVEHRRGPPAGFELLYCLNVTVSRAQALAVLVCNPALSAPWCLTPEQVRLVNALCRFLEDAVEIAATEPR